jgi:ribosomal protein S18 acetylase RimI-like enzyme
MEPPMIEVRRLLQFNRQRFQEIASGYITDAIYRVAHQESAERTVFTLTLEPLDAPREFRYPFTDEDFERYEALVPGEYCFAAYDRDEVVAVALAEPADWNQTLWVWDFHVSETHRGRGIGRRLMDALVARSLSAGLRAVVCETQNTNVPAIRFYRAVGFTLEGVDISYYTNEDMLPGGTVAVFMKRRLT